MKKNLTCTLITLVFLYGVAFAQKKTEKKTQPEKKPQTEKSKPAKSQDKVLSEPTPLQSNSVVGEQQASSAQGENMAAWMNYMTPGPMHEMMAKYSGKWNEEVTYWMNPNEPPTVSKATCTNTMIMGNRYQESKHYGEMQGMSFEGNGILGFDNVKKVFVSSWFDNMGTGIVQMEGKIGEKGDVIHFSGKAVDPVSGAEMPVREEFTMIDENTQTMEMFMSFKGNEVKTMSIRFTRQK